MGPKFMLQGIGLTAGLAAMGAGTVVMAGDLMFGGRRSVYGDGMPVFAGMAVGLLGAGVSVGAAYSAVTMGGKAPHGAAWTAAAMGAAAIAGLGGAYVANLMVQSDRAAEGRR